MILWIQLSCQQVIYKYLQLNRIFKIYFFFMYLSKLFRSFLNQFCSSYEMCLVKLEDY